MSYPWTGPRRGEGPPVLPLRGHAHCARMRNAHISKRVQARVTASHETLLKLHPFFFHSCHHTGYDSLPSAPGVPRGAPQPLQPPLPPVVLDPGTRRRLSEEDVYLIDQPRQRRQRSLHLEQNFAATSEEDEPEVEEGQSGRAASDDGTDVEVDFTVAAMEETWTFDECLQRRGCSATWSSPSTSASAMDRRAWPRRR